MTSFARTMAGIISTTGDVKPTVVGDIGLSVYSTLDSLPTSALTSGDQAFVSENNRIYVSNGSGWYNVALLNATPTLSISPSGAVTLATDGSTPTVITLIGKDSDNADASLTYTVESDGSFSNIATLSQDSSVFTITPLAEGSATPGSSTLTFKVSDGISFGSGTTEFSLTFGPNWSATPTESKLTASDAQSLDWFGWHSSISDDGNYAIIGAFGEDPLNNQAGAAYIFVRSGSTWTQQAKLVASPAGSFNDYFGWNVDINSDGTYAIVGAILGDNGSVETGAAYVFTRSGSTWTQQAKIAVTLVGANPQASDFFGYSVQINSDGTTAIIGANQADIDAPNQGAAFVFVRSGSTWTQQWRLYATDRQQDDEFGCSVSISSDGNYALIGARYEDTVQTGAGAAYFWTRSGTSWSPGEKIQASDPGLNDWFGESVSINSDATYAVVGAYNKSGGGAAYVFTRSGSTWTQQQKLTASDAQSGDRFGYSVAISGDGQYIGIGAYDEDTAGSVAGAVYVFERSGSTWTELKKLTASDAQAGDEFGRGVGLSNDGKYLITGARDEDGGAGDTIPDAGTAYIYEA